MSGILRKLAPIGNQLERQVTSIVKSLRQFYFDANGFVGAQDSL
ncbi:phosphoribosylformyl-glycineamide synthetase [Enterobacter roggenkampii]|nr:phosphoribosylformyl-glycineamide synthetase [Enterobacter roggenkampii]TXU88730.1 phosphoribosylformyl-glycineamide synthetase [Enterobacter roggenkampii]TXU99319.1 phosphoribosylformyl-glycineamide synthetase [Enterobacter roggenkampii]TYF69850.1 phosphoribosylformyl-glycineamide synthetase [Enterobacter roggenkampii]